MYNLRWLASVARQGLSDMLPAARQALNDDPTDDRLPLVYGERGLPSFRFTATRELTTLEEAESDVAEAESPEIIHSAPEVNPSAPATTAPPPWLSMRWRLLAMAVIGVVAGSLFKPFVPDLPIFESINWPAVFLGGFHAILFRRYLFGTSHARNEDFPWLAASLAPSLAVLMVMSFVGWLSTADHEGGAIGWLAHVLVSGTHALGVAASLIIAVAALCFSRDWPRALVQLCVRLFVFRIMVWVTTLVILEIGVVGPIVAGVLRGVFGFSIPQWITDTVDAFSYAGVMVVIYLAVIGATWTVCRQRFGALLRTGDVDILKAVASLASDPEKKRKREEKKAQKEQEKLEKARKKKEKK